MNFLYYSHLLARHSRPPANQIRSLNSLPSCIYLSYFITNRYNISIGIQNDTIAKSMACPRKSPRFPHKAKLKAGTKFHQEWPNIKFRVKTPPHPHPRGLKSPPLGAWVGGQKKKKKKKRLIIYFKRLPMLIAHTKFHFKMFKTLLAITFPSIWHFDPAPGGRITVLAHSCHVVNRTSLVNFCPTV